MNLKFLNPKALWSRQSVRVGAMLAFTGGAIGTVANLNAIVGIFTPDRTTEIVVDTHSAIASADAKIDELLTLMRTRAALAGGDIDPRSEDMIKTALHAILTSGDERKSQARQALAAGDVEAAAAEIVKVARDQAEAASETGKAAAESWKEAGALFEASQPATAIAAYEEARRLHPADLEVWNAIGSLQLVLGAFEAASAMFEHVRTVADPASAELAWAIQGLGAVAHKRGDAAQAVTHFTAAYDLARALGADRVASVAANNLGVQARRGGDLARAEKFLTEGLVHARKAERPALEARVLDQLGLVAFLRGEKEKGAELVKRANDIYDSRGELRHQATTIGNLGAMALSQGDTATAARYIAQSIELGERLGLKASVAEDHSNLAELERQLGNFPAARVHIDKASAIVEEISLVNLRPYLVVTLAQIEQDEGHLAEACALYATAIAEFSRLGDATGETAAEYARKAGCGAS